MALMPGAGALRLSLKERMVSYYASLSLSLGSLARLPLPKVPYGQKGLDHFETQTERYWALGVCVCVCGQDTPSLFAPREGSKLNGEPGGVPGRKRLRPCVGRGWETKVPCLF